jgi:hypothetical protein
MCSASEKRIGVALQFAWRKGRKAAGQVARSFDDGTTPNGRNTLAPRPAELEQPIGVHRQQDQSMTMSGWLPISAAQAMKKTQFAPAAMQGKHVAHPAGEDGEAAGPIHVRIDYESQAASVRRGSGVTSTWPAGSSG